MRRAVHPARGGGKWRSTHRYRAPTRPPPARLAPRQTPTVATLTRATCLRFRASHARARLVPCCPGAAAPPDCRPVARPLSPIQTNTHLTPRLSRSELAAARAPAPTTPATSACMRSCGAAGGGLSRWNVSCPQPPLSSPVSVGLPVSLSALFLAPLPLPLTTCLSPPHPTPCILHPILMLRAQPSQPSDQAWHPRTVPHPGCAPGSAPAAWAFILCKWCVASCILYRPAQAAKLAHLRAPLHPSFPRAYPFSTDFHIVCGLFPLASPARRCVSAPHRGLRRGGRPPSPAQSHPPPSLLSRCCRC